MTCNVWLLDSPEMVLNYSLQGGKIVFITEDADPRLEYIPNKLSAKILLPAYDAMEAELDGRLEEAQVRYWSYLSCLEPADYISVLMAAVITGVPIGLYFGSEMKDLKYPAMFIEYLYSQKGIVVGYKNVAPSIIDSYIPFILSEIYGKGLISVDRFMCLMPENMDLPPIIIPMLVGDLQPPKGFINNGDYNKYFKDLIREIKKSNKYLFNPIIAAREE